MAYIFYLIQLMSPNEYYWMPPQAPVSPVERVYTIGTTQVSKHAYLSHKASVGVVITDDPETWTEHECLSRNAFFEARGEGIHGMALVTQTVLNRVNSNKRYFPNTPCQVVRQKINKSCSYSWFCDGKPDRPSDLNTYLDAKKVATRALEGQYKHLVKVKYYKHCGTHSSFFNTLSYKFRYKNHCYYSED